MKPATAAEKAKTIIDSVQINLIGINGVSDVSGRQ